MYLVMDYCNEGDLCDYINKTPYIPANTKVQILRQILKAVDHIHNHNIIHADLNTCNIFLHKDEQGKLVVKVGDFGLALLAGEKRSECIEVPAFIAPEIWKAYQNQETALPYSRKSDMWSIGMILLNILSNNICEKPYYEQDTHVMIT